MNPIALISTKKGLFQLLDNLTLQPIGFLGVPVTIALATKNHNQWYAGLNHGHFGVKFHRSLDKGSTWEEMNAPQYPQNEGAKEDSTDADKGASLKLIWSLEFADKNDSTKLWAGTIPGGLFYSQDSGDTWQLNEPLWQYKLSQEWFGGGFDEAGIHSICVHPANASHINVAVSCAGVWQTKDNGMTWKNESKGMRAEYMPPEQAFDPTIQDPHLLVQCPTSPDDFWVQHHNGIFKSIDGANNWSEITTATPSNFGFAVAVHPKDSNTAWFVPAVKDECRIPVDNKFVVMKTTDGGQSFTTHTKGLPTDISFDIVYRHALDVDETGEKLLMGSTTGNLWLSEDQGQSWRCLSHHLPPIFAVRFIK